MTSRVRRLLLAMPPLCALLAPLPAAAHQKSTSYSTWELRGRGAHVVLRLTALDVSRFPWAATAGNRLGHAVGRYAVGQLQLLAGDEPCVVSDGPRRLLGAPGHLVIEWSLACAPTGSLRLRSRLLHQVAPSHLHFARVRLPGGSTVEHIFSEGRDTWVLPAASASSTQAGSTTVGDYVRLGIEHILGGYDHLVFVLGLLLLGSSAADVARVVTGFTVAHSITLGLTVLGYLHPNREAINALIGLSIALVAWENVWLTGRRGPAQPALACVGLLAMAVAGGFGFGCVPPVSLAGLALFCACYFGLLARAAHPASLRWAVAFLFGLVHGSSFAGVLLEARLTTERIVPALFGFNLGVEIGQLGVVVLIWPVLRRLMETREGRLRAPVIEVGSAAVLAVGLYWFVLRAYR